MLAVRNITFVVSTVNTVETTTQKGLYYPNLASFNYLVKNFTKDQAMVETDSVIIWNTHPAGIKVIQWFDELYVKPCKVADVYGESMFNEIVIIDVDFSIYHSLQK